MESASRDISSILGLHRHGGTMIQRDTNTFILVDHEMISFHAMETINTLHPCLHISTQASAESTSGFMVVFVYRPHNGILCTTSTVLYACMVLCLSWSVILICVHSGAYTHAASPAHS